MLGNFICQYGFWQRPSNDVTLQMFIWSCNIWLQSVNQAPYMRILKSTECILHHFLYSIFTRMLTWKRFYRYAKSTLSSRNHVYSFTYTVDYTDVSKFPFNILRPRQNDRHFPDVILNCIFLNENVWISNKISLKFVPKGQINNIPALVQIMAWRRPGDKPLSEPMLVSLRTHICVTRPQWV